ncbi:MAG: transposase [Armatimonadota bacterium]
MRHSDAYRDVIAYLNTLDEETRHRKLHRLPHESYTISDTEYFFTICARHLGVPFTNDALARKIIEVLLWYHTHNRWILYCYCLMPDHLHFIVKLPELTGKLINAGARGMLIEGILEQVGYFKSYTTSQCWWKHGGQGQLWQKSSYDHVIKYNDSVDEAIDYVLNNSTRKELVETWDQYPYAGLLIER